MRTPKTLYPTERRIYHPEIAVCPHCGEGMKLWNSLAWNKTVQTLEGTYSLASRPSHCPRIGCLGEKLRLLSACGEKIVPIYSTYGYDVLVQIGWRHQDQRMTFREIHRELRAEEMVISEAQVRYLYQQYYLPLLACSVRRLKDQLDQAVRDQGGLFLALDGLAPEGGEPQLWFVRELTTGLTLRSGWLSRQDQKTFEAFLQPLVQPNWRILGILSDKQTGLVPAVASVFPSSLHAFCQTHYLSNLAGPLAGADQSFKVELRKAVREQIGPLLQAETPLAGEEGKPEKSSGVLTVTGVCPTPLPSETSSWEEEPLFKKEKENDLLAAEELIEGVVLQVVRRLRYLLTLNGRPPFRLAGVETYQGLKELWEWATHLLRHRTEPRLEKVAHGLSVVLTRFESDYRDLHQSALWLQEIAQLLDPSSSSSRTDAPSSGAQIAQQLREYLDRLLQLPDLPSSLAAFRLHLDKVSRSYWSGLFHCYDQPKLPRTNNGLESHFRETRRRLLRTTGQKGETQRTLQRRGAWELLPSPPSEALTLNAFLQVDPQDFAKEQLRYRLHQLRFLLHTRSARRVRLHMNRLLLLWLRLPPDSTA